MARNNQGQLKKHMYHNIYIYIYIYIVKNGLEHLWKVFFFPAAWKNFEKVSLSIAENQQTRTGHLLPCQVIYEYLYAPRV